MPGLQANFVARGADNELLAQYLLGQIANPVRVMRENDFGVDFYWQVRVERSDLSHTVRGLFAMQVKGKSERLEYGGFGNGKRAKWMEEEIQWLRESPVPMFFARVDPEARAVDVFSLGPVLRVFGRVPAPMTPFRIVFDSGESTNTRQGVLPEQDTPVRDAPGDGKEWLVRLGPPFLRVALEDRAQPEFVAMARSILHKWMALEWRNWAYYHLGVHAPLMFGEWATNERAELAPADFFYEHAYWTNRNRSRIGRLRWTLVGARPKNPIAKITYKPVLTWDFASGPMLADGPSRPQRPAHQRAGNTGRRAEGVALQSDGADRRA